MKLGAAVAVALFLLVSACGNTRPSVSDLSKSMQHGVDVAGSGSTRLPKRTADCIAGLLEKSDASDGFLKAIADNDQKYKLSKNDKDVLKGLNVEASRCLTPAS